MLLENVQQGQSLEARGRCGLTSEKRANRLLLLDLQQQIAILMLQELQASVNGLVSLLQLHLVCLQKLHFSAQLRDQVLRSLACFGRTLSVVGTPLQQTLGVLFLKLGFVDRVVTPTLRRRIVEYRRRMSFFDRTLGWLIG